MRDIRIEQTSKSFKSLLPYYLYKIYIYYRFYEIYIYWVRILRIFKKKSQIPNPFSLERTDTYNERYKHRI